MQISDIVFPDSLPKLDLHGYDRVSARVQIEDFILDNVKMKNEFVMIIHGIGEGILRKTTIDCLSKNKHVSDYKSAYNNMGSVIVKLDVV